MLNRREFAGLAVAGATTSLSATTAVAAEAEGTIAYHVLASSHVPGEPGLAIYAPPGYDAGRAEPYPLLLLLHGGNGTEKDLAFFKTVFDNEIAAGRLPPLIIATPSGRRSLYMDFRDGAERWESFILVDVLPFLRRSAHVSRGRELTFIGGWSMGGLGSLRIAFKHPELFAAVAALEPAVEPAVEWKGSDRIRVSGGPKRFSIRYSAIRSTANIGCKTIRHRSQAVRPTDCSASAFIWRSATRICSIFMRARSFCTASCSTPGSHTNIGWSMALSISVPRFCRAWPTRSALLRARFRRRAGSTKMY